MKDFLTRWVEEMMKLLILTLLMVVYVAFICGFLFLLIGLFESGYYWVAMLFVVGALALFHWKP